jgi:prevent-host-death family protein
MATWALADAKAKFSEVVDKAVNHGPQEVTRNGKDAVMVVSKQDWLNSRRVPAQSHRSMADFFRESPLSGSDIDLRRKRSTARKIEL